MAARFWSFVLALQLALGLALAEWCTDGHRALAPLAALIVVAVPAGSTCAAVALSFALAGASTRAAGASRLQSGRLRAFLTELPGFAAACSAMIAEAWRAPERPAPIPPDRPQAGARGPVLLLHGFACNRAVFAPLRQRLLAAGFAPVYAPDLQPLCAAIEVHVAAAARALQQLGRQAGAAPVTIIAHSMGGLVARALLSIVEPDRIACILTIGTPHHGTALARWLPCRATRQMRPDCAWLRALNAGQEGRLAVPITSLYSTDDNIIAPPDSAVLRGARLRALHGLGHFGLLRSRRALNAITALLAQPPAPVQPAHERTGP